MRLPRILWPVLLFTGALGLTAWAETPTPEKVAPATDTVIYPRPAALKDTLGGGASPRSGSSGLIITALVMAAAGGWLYWRARRTPGGLPAVRHLAIAETKALGNRQYLVVAAYQNKKFLLGVCPGRIDLLTPLDDQPPVRQP